MTRKHHDVEMRLDVKVPMRDGVELSADIYLPEGAGPFPTVLMRTPYSNNMDLVISKARRLANFGYACVVQDTRGRWDSDGSYYPMIHEQLDGFDTQEWVAAQPWSTGRIGMSGGSYGGWVQWSSAVEASDHLTCTVPRVMCSDIHRLVHPGGATQLSVLMTWGMRTNGRTGQSIDFHDWTEAFTSLPVIALDRVAGRDLQFWRDWISHPSDGDYWAGQRLSDHWSRMNAPALIMGGWYDLYSTDVFDEFVALRSEGGSPEARQSRLVVGPWPHGLSLSPRTGDVDFGAGSMLDLDDLELGWFDHWLNGDENGVTEEPPLKLFIMGVNEWRDESEWPLARTDWQKWHLHSGGSANTLLGDGALSTETPTGETSDAFTYDPLYPVQTLGGNNCCSPEIVPWGPYDQRPAEMRTDVLCYTSEPMADDLEVTGPIKAVIYAATDGPDTDWTAKLVDVSPSGYAMNLCDGITRARYRESFDTPRLLEPGTVYEYRISAGVTGNVFRKGHRIRLDISSSNFPRFDRNLNTAEDPGVGTETRQARQTVLHTKEHPSHVLLPVIPAD